MTQPAALARRGPSPYDVRKPGVVNVHCTGCGERLLEYTRPRVKEASLKPAELNVRCKRARCHTFTRVAVEEEVLGGGVSS